MIEVMEISYEVICPHAWDLKPQYVVEMKYAIDTFQVTPFYMSEHIMWSVPVALMSGFGLPVIVMRRWNG